MQMSSSYLVKTYSCMPLPLLLISNPSTQTLPRQLCQYLTSSQQRSHAGRDHQRSIAVSGAVIPRSQECGFHGFIEGLLQGSKEQWTCSHTRTYSTDWSFFLVHDDTALPHKKCYFTVNSLYQHSLLSYAGLKRTHPRHSLLLILH